MRFLLFGSVLIVVSYLWGSPEPISRMEAGVVSGILILLIGSHAIQRRTLP